MGRGAMLSVFGLHLLARGLMLGRCWAGLRYPVMCVISLERVKIEEKKGAAVTAVGGQCCVLLASK